MHTKHLSVGMQKAGMVGEGTGYLSLYSGGDYAGSAFSSVLPYSEQIANAKLWAASPQLLAECRSVLDSLLAYRLMLQSSGCTSWIDYQRHIDGLTRAIALAEGRDAPIEVPALVPVPTHDVGGEG